MVVKFNHLLPAMPELGMGLPNAYTTKLRKLLSETSVISGLACRRGKAK